MEHLLTRELNTLNVCSGWSFDADIRLIARGMTPNALFLVYPP